jgi:quercetin dioxygenase-like cupin family protein
MAFGLYIALMAGLAGSGQTALPFVPATVPFDNKIARVQLSSAAPKEVTPPHVHLTNRVMIYFDAGTNKITYQNGVVKPEVFRAGDVQWNNAMGTHTAEIIAPGPVNIAHVELKSPPNMVLTVQYSAMDPLKVAPGQYRKEIDNNQVRVLRLHLDRGEKAPMHEERFEQLLVPLTAASLKVTDAQGKAKNVVYKQAELQWLPPGTEADENIGDAPYEALIVEFKK